MNLTEQHDSSTLGPKSLDNDKIKRYTNKTLRKKKRNHAECNVQIKFKMKSDVMLHARHDFERFQ